MKKAAFFVLLVFILAMNFAITGCDKTTGEDTDTWTYLTSLAQVHGTWKGSYSATESEYGITATTVAEITMIINADAETASGTMKITMTFSGAGISGIWDDIKSRFPSQPDVDVTVNDANHSITMTQDIPEESITGDDLGGVQINRSGTKMRLPAGMFDDDSPEIEFIRQ
jgi:hypothetical protein